MEEPGSRGSRGPIVAAITVLLASAAAILVVALIVTGFLTRVGGPGPVASAGGGGPGPVASSGGLRIEYQVVPDGGAEPSEADTAAVAAVIARRLDATGIVAPSVTSQPSGRIVVELAVDPSDEATARAVRQLTGTTGRIDFVPLGTTSIEAGQPVDLARHPPLFAGDQVASAGIGQNQDGLRTVDLTLDHDAAALFAAYTRDHVGEYFAIVGDGVALSVPVIQSAIEGGNVQIMGAGAGGFPLDEAQALVTIIGSGPLPFPVQEVANNLP
jgi:preprotein translocase subunit SecD